MLCNDQRRWYWRGSAWLLSGLSALSCSPSDAASVHPASDQGESGSAATSGAANVADTSVGAGGAQSRVGGAGAGSGGLSVVTPGAGAGAGAGGGVGGALTGGGASGAAGTTGKLVVSPVTDGKQIVHGPYASPPEATRQPGVPRARLEHFVFDTSQVFPGTSRNVDVLIPAQYVAGNTAPLMVVQDGDEQQRAFKTDIVVENLIFQKKLPVMVVIFVNRADNGPKRSLEYDCLDDDYSSFILSELVPEVKARFPELSLTSDPDGRAALGKSSGGPAAFTLGWRHPELFRRITTLNGSFVKRCKDGTGADAYPNLIKATEPPKPLRVYLFSGSNDNAGFAAGNQAMADALAAKGYAWRYVFGEGAGHGNDYGASLIVEALLWTWAGYPL
ncbi:MAG TPA: alpha/beta hydrolase-fold protein [Polyangiaceae bacterium]|nr:alpha/beta hydrolase-fold protein [Polyangiaceae bacterium]